MEGDKPLVKVSRVPNDLTLYSIIWLHMKFAVIRCPKNGGIAVFINRMNVVGYPLYPLMLMNFLFITKDKSNNDYVIKGSYSLDEMYFYHSFSGKNLFFISISRSVLMKMEIL